MRGISPLVCACLPREELSADATNCTYSMDWFSAVQFVFKEDRVLWKFILEVLDSG